MLINGCTTDKKEESSLYGLWLFTEVQVGEEAMTPVARWTRIHEDGTFESGNGWLKNSIGTWTYTDSTKAFLPIQTNGIKDEAGAFTVTFNDDEMIWERTEEGMPVIVHIKRISELPAAPADRIVGMWELEDNQALDPEFPAYIFLRWDREYRQWSKDGQRSTGFWHMDGHRPNMTLMSHQQRSDPESWTIIQADDFRLILNGISDTNRDVKLSFRRYDRFPSF